MSASLREGKPVEHPRPLLLDDPVTLRFGLTPESGRGDMPQEVEMRSHESRPEREEQH